MWTIHHTSSVLGTPQERQELAERITDHYHRIGLPRFYVVVAFHRMDPDELYVAGRPATNALRIGIDHIARRLPDDDARRATTRWIAEILRPVTDSHDGLHWEFHADETSDQLWMISGFVPPPARSAAERAWSDSNRAAPYVDAGGASDVSTETVGTHRASS